jgi:hypothetical protein
MALTQVQPGMLASDSQYTGFKSRIINGAMVIDQRNAGASVTNTTGNLFPVDRFKIAGSVASKFTAQQNAGSITPPAGFTNYLGITSSSAYSVGASDYFALTQNIEGFNTADLDFGKSTAKTITLSFQVYSSLTGSFGGSLSNSAETRSYPFTYSIPVANTWTSISITIAGDTTGTWLTTNGTGMEVNFSLGVGSTYSGTAGAWINSWKLAPTSSVNVVSTSGATFYITGVQLEKGSTATSFDYRPYGQELMLCQRYFLPMQCVNWCGYRPTASTGALQVPFTYPILRAAPTFTQLSGTVNGSNVTFDVGQAQSNYLRLYHNNTYSAGTVAEASLSFTLSAEL